MSKIFRHPIDRNDQIVMIDDFIEEACLAPWNEDLGEKELMLKCGYLQIARHVFGSCDDYEIGISLRSYRFRYLDENSSSPLYLCELLYNGVSEYHAFDSLQSLVEFVGNFLPIMKNVHEISEIMFQEDLKRG